MSKYYYLVSQLPFLHWGKSLPVTRNYFLQESEKWLNRQDYRMLLHADINDFSYNKRLPFILQEYRKFEFNLRGELALLRKVGILDAGYKGSAGVRAIFSEGNPLVVEKNLLFLRWKFIEEKQKGHYFDLDFLFLYFLKLQISERLVLFDKDKGLKKFDILTSGIKCEF